MSSQLVQTKKVLRVEMKRILSEMSKESRRRQSEVVTKKVIESPIYKNSQRVGVYLSMEEEVSTGDLVKHILSSGKTCFIPWYDKSVMKMVQLKSIGDLESLPKNKWNIAQPDSVEDREDSFTQGGLDLVLVPGLAFTKNGSRLGRGKGYYDKFLTTMKTHTVDSGLRQLTTMALAFDEQVIDEIPMSETDFRLDAVVQSGS